jgi:hypothetical protein
VANKILVARGTKARIEEIKSTLTVNELVYSTDTGELGVKKASGDIEYFMNAADINALVNTLETSKQDKLVAGENITIDENNVISASDEIDLNMLGYMNYAADIFYRARRQSLFANAWEHSLTVDPTNVSSTQYPNGETKPVIIPHGATKIGGMSFFNWALNNQPLVIPNSVTIIDGIAFAGWSSNNQPLVIPDSVTTIGMNAFQNWSANTHPLVIPSSVTSIGGGAFLDWSSVPYVEIQSLTPPSLGSSSVFNGQNDAPIYVPDESVGDYKTATNWVDLASRIFPISDKANVMGDIESALDAILGV